MMYFTEVGLTYQEAIDKAKMKYGPAAQVTGYRTVESGGFLGFFSKEKIEVQGYIRQQSASSSNEKNRDDEEMKKILQLARKKAGAAEEVKEPKEDLHKALLEEMKTMKDELKSEFNKRTGPVKFEHPSLLKVEELLFENDFSRTYTQSMLDRFRKEFPLGDLEDWKKVVDTLWSWIAETVLIHEEKPVPNGRIFTLVGPTGIGKTTTLAKLAGLYRLGLAGEGNKNIVLITIDNYRIGAKAQFETYGSIMEVPVYAVETAEILRQRIQAHPEASVFLVDTVGKSPKDFLKLAEMRQILEGCGKKAEIHLAVSSTTKTKDVKEILQQFETFSYTSVVLTKMDETTQVGNLISILWEKGKPISYITDGQSVPQDLHKATKELIMKNLTGFNFERSNHG